MQKIHWILQSNLIREKVFNEIKDSLIEDNISFEEVKIIPFSDELPAITKELDINVFYGSTTLVLNAYRKYGVTKGIFYDSSKFNVRTYLRNWNDRMLNYDSSISTFSDFISLDKDENSLWFVRPIEDDKSFSGKVMPFNEIKKFGEEIKHSNNPYLTTETLVAFSSPKKIDKEWRLFIIDKKVISACRYIENGALSVSNDDVPPGMIQFAQDCCKIYTPGDVFVMDTAVREGRYFIVECNCFNDTGFYGHDIREIIRGVNKYLHSS